MKYKTRKSRVADIRPEINSIWQEYFALKANPSFIMYNNWKKVICGDSDPSPPPYLIELRNKLVDAYIRDVQIIAIVFKRKKRIPAHVTYEDLLSPAYETLIHMIDTYDASRACFKTYMMVRINGSMLDWLRSKNSRSAVSHEKTKNEAEEQMERVRCNRIRQDEIRENINNTNFKDRETNLKLMNPISLSLLGGTYNRLGAKVELPDSHKDPLTSVENFDFCAHIEKLAENLNLHPKTQDVIKMYYFEGKTMKEVASKINMCEASVFVIHRAFIKRMKEVFRVVA